MSVAYRKFFGPDGCTVRVVNGFDLDMERCKGSFLVTEEIGLDTILLESAIRQYCTDVMKMHPNAIVLWECTDMDVC